MSSQLSQYGYAAGNGAAFTTDFGQTWSPVTLPGSGNITSFYVEAYMFALYARGSQIYLSTNFTQPFTLQYTSPNGGNYTQISLSVFVFEGGCRGGWGAKDNGTLSRYFTIWGGIRKINSLIPDNYSLSQNYPNPFNPVTKIKFAVPTPLNPPFSQRGEERSGGGFVTLTVYDILGREVAVLVNEQLKPGTYEVEFSAIGGGTNYPSGVYFYKLLTADYAETKKMLLLK
jgi:hypothetical protein